MVDLFTVGVHIVNIILLIGLLVIYIRNYKNFKLKYTGGLIFFAAFFLIETLMALYFDTSMVMYYSTAAELNASILSVIKAVGLAILLWISLE